MLNAEVQGQLLTELYISTHVSQEMILKSRSLRMARLLIEQVDVTGTAEKVKTQKIEFLKVIKFFEDEGAGQLAIELTKLVKAIPDPSKLYAAAYGEDENKVKTLTKEFTDKLMKANLGISSIFNAMIELKKALTPFFEELDEDARSQTIGELCDSKDESQNFIAKDKLTKGILKAFVPQKTFKDAFKKGAERASRGSEGKSKMGKLFSTAFKFLGGFFAKPPGESFPKLFIAFKEYVFASSLTAFFEVADKLSVKGKQLVGNAGMIAGEASTEATTLAGGAKPEDGKTGGVASAEGDTPEDEKTATSDAKKVASEISSEVDSMSIGKLIKKNVLGTIQPFVDRKSLSKKDRESLQKSVTDLEDRLRTTSRDEAKPVAGEFGRTLKNWYDSLDPKIQAKLGGAKGSEKVLNGIAKNVTDNIEKSFNFESKHNKGDMMVERWQRLAGIK
jgi:hypothetical protein